MDFDVAVIGAGMAGASLAAALAGRGQRVVLVERETQPGYHTTGRSAAIYAPLYGNAAVRALTRASLPLFESPPAAFGTEPLLRPRACLFYARAEQRDDFEAFCDAYADEPQAPRVLTDAAAIAALQPVLRPASCDRAALDLTASDMDVHAILQGYLRLAAAAGCERRMGFELSRAERNGGGWRLHAQGAGQAPIEVARVAICAGAWADPLAAVFDVVAPGIEPRRRTAMVVDCGEGALPADAPLSMNFVEDVYFRPEAGHVFLSPADETPSAPCDAQPDELDIAIAIDRLQRDTVLPVRRVVAKWAGLRSFHADRSPVVGLAPRADGGIDDTVFWMVGQGGYGIQMAPALADLAAARMTGAAVPAYIDDEGLDLAEVAPGRTP